MKFKLSRRGLWLRGAHSQRLLPWFRVSGLALYPLLLTLFLLLAVSHQEPILEYFIFAQRSSDWRAAEIGKDIFTERSVVGLRNVLQNQQPPQDSEIPVFRLFTSDSTLEQMVAALHTGDPAIKREAGGTRPYFSAYLSWNDAKAARCKISLRGFGFWHHAPEKPSLRVKVKKEDIFLGRRYMEFQRPEDPLAMTNWLPERLAQKMELMSQNTEHVALFFNHRLLGLYDLTYRPGEALALNNERMPGTFLKGDILSSSGRIGDPNRSLWTGSKEWRILGEESPFALERFELMLKTMDSEHMSGIENFLDLDKMARWSAVMAFIGSNHSDANHNQVFFYDSTRGLFEPVLWDPNGFGLQLKADAHIDKLASPIEQKLFQFADWRALRRHYLQVLLDSDWAEKSYTQELERILPWLQADPHLSELHGTVLGVNRLKHYSARDLEALQGKLESWLRIRRANLRAYLQSDDFSPGKAEILTAKPLPSKTLGPGRVSLQESLLVEDLEIKAGTQVVLGPGVGIFVKGRLEALGTKERPIGISGRDWGCFSMEGPEPKTLRFVSFEGGSLGKREGVAFKGMVNAYNCEDVQFLDCHFSANQKSDDMVNAASSVVRFENCRFDEANADALDLDMCQAVVVSCVFSQSGNDGLDVMNSEVLVESCEFIASGDKGMSCGEESQVKLEHCNFKDCQIGLQAKDNSKVWLKDSEVQSEIALSCYRKKWFYPRGGEILIDNSSWKGKLDIQALSQIFAPESSQSADQDLTLKFPEHWKGLKVLSL